MNAYITLDGKKYATVQKNWSPASQKSVTIRPLADGDMDVSFGNGNIRSYKGEIVAVADETRTGWGTSSDLVTSLDKMQVLTLIDHNNNTYNCVCQGWKHRSLTPKWDSGKQYYEVSLVVYA